MSVSGLTIMMPLMDIMDDSCGGGCCEINKEKQNKGSFGEDGRYRLSSNEILTLASSTGCLVQITADSKGQVRHINICATRDRQVEITLNGRLK